jgi:Do/DeqQ family serine protease
MEFRNFFKSQKVLIINIALVSIIVGFVIGIVFFNATTNLSNGSIVKAQDTSQTKEGLQALQNIQYSFRSVAQKVLPVVVEIDVVDKVTQSVPDTAFPFDFFFGPNNDNNNNDNNNQPNQPKQREYSQEGLGSGVIVQKDGDKVYVLTNNHVAGEADTIKVKVYNGKTYDAKLVGKDERKDLALVMFTTNDKIQVAELGDSDQSFVGDWVLAIGNPLGFDYSVTAGIVSAVGRRGGPTNNISDFIQTDASINQGNSGGALVNINGQVIGINTWIATKTGTSAGLGFAIPINNAKTAITNFIKFGKVEYGWLGVQIYDPGDVLLKDLKIEDTKGSLVSQVFKNSPADKGGFLPGDYITKVDTVSINDTNHLLAIIGDIPSGKTSAFEVVRQGKKMTLTVTLTKRADEKELAAQNKNLWPGLSVVPITDDIRTRLELDKGLKGLVIGNIIQNTPADIAGFEAGDVIKQINNENVATMFDFYKLLNDKSKKDISFTYTRKGVDLKISIVR